MRSLVVSILIVFSAAFNSAFAEMTTGTYVGDGEATQAITGVGGTPDVLLVKEAGSGTAWITTSTMPAGEAKLLTDIDYGPKTGMISSLDADGFTVGNTGGVSNDDGVTYYYVAFAGDASIDVSSFTPGSAGVISVDVGYRPSMVWLLGGAEGWDEKSPAQFLMDGQSSSTVFQFNNGGALVTASYKVLDSITNDGFDTRAATASGTHNGPGVGIEYHYVTFKANSYAEFGDYPGDNGTAQDISLSGNPDFIMVKNTAGGDNTWFRTSDMSGTDSYKFTDAAAASNITALSNSPKQFSVGTSGEVNGSNSYDYISFTGLSALPVELINFNCFVDPDLKHTVLSWRTAAEINSSHFEIQKSFDGINWFSIGIENGQGTYSGITEYQFVDHAAESKVVYYRLNQFDFDGSNELSKTIIARGPDQGKVSNLSLFPNPVIDHLALEFSVSFEETVSVTLLDSQGKIISINQIEKALGFQYLNFNVSSLSGGVYIVRIMTESGWVSTSRFTK